MRELLLVLNVKAHSVLKSSFDLRWQALLKNLSSLIIFGGVAVGVFFLARTLTAYLLDQASIGLFLYHRFLSMLLYVFFVAVNLGNMIVCYATLYKSTEVSFLMGLPIAHENIFLIKFVDNFFYSSSTLTLLGLSWLLGYGSYFNLPWTFYFFTMFGVLLPFTLIAGIIAVMLLMVLIRVAARFGVRVLLAGVVVVYLSAVYLYFRVTNPVTLVEEVMRNYPNVNEYFGYLDAPFVRYFPNHWVAEFLYWTIRGDHVRAAPYLVILLLSLAGLVIVAGMMARRLYYRSWLAASDAHALGGAGSSRWGVAAMGFGARGPFRPQTDALLRRDFWMFVREPSQWLHMMLMLLLLLIFLVALGSIETRLTQPFLQMVSYLVIFLFNCFFIASVSLRFVFPAVSLEGDAFWAVRSAPLSLRRLYLYKLLTSLALVLLVGEMLAVLANLLVWDNPLLVGVSAAATAFVALALTGMNLGSGAYFATYREKNPIRVASSQGASLTFLASMIYLGMVVSVLVLPLNNYFEGLILRGAAGGGWAVVPLVAIGALSVVLFAFFTVAGLRALRRDY